MGKHTTRQMIKELINSGLIKGLWKEEVLLDIYGTNVAGLRIDAVCFGVDNNIYIIEAKKELDLKALGQLLGYTTLFAEQFNVSWNRLKMIALCETANTKIREVFQKFGIDVITLNQLKEKQKAYTLSEQSQRRKQPKKK